MLGETVNGPRGTATALVLVHLALAIGHGAAHEQLGVRNPLWLDALIVAFVVLGLLLAVALLWTRRVTSGWWLLGGSAAGALVISLLSHYVVPSPDHVAHLPAAPGQAAFKWTAIGLALTQAALALFAAWGVLLRVPGAGEPVTDPNQPHARLAPIDRPHSPWMRLIFWLVRRKLGMVPTPFRVVYPRRPGLAGASAKIGATSRRRLSLPRSEALLITAYAARLNGCAFCEDLALAEAVMASIGTERFAALDDPETATTLSEREKAALAALREYAERRTVTDSTWRRLCDHFSEGEILEVLWLNAAEQYYNALNIPLGLGSDHLSRRG